MALNDTNLFCLKSRSFNPKGVSERERQCECNERVSGKKIEAKRERDRERSLRATKMNTFEV